MRMKFASKKVNGWNSRYLHPIKILASLDRRMINGFTLTSEELQFYEDIKSLIKKFNS